jgi:integration host factor subunit beta
MIKSTLITTMVEKLQHISEKDVTEGINLILEKIENALVNGNRIEIRGFGSFSLHYRPPRNAHNPKTGERLMTTPKYSPHFKPGKEMRDRINQSRDIPIKGDSEES